MKRKMRFEGLTPTLVAAVEPWFDDPDTIRYLGGRHWLHRELDLMRDAPGVEFRGNVVLSRHVWIIFDEADQPVGLVDVEPYVDGTAGMVFVVAPHLRGQGVGQRILLALAGQEELKDVRTVMGGVEPDNTACRICLTKAGFSVSRAPDEEGMLRVEKRLF